MGEIAFAGQIVDVVGVGSELGEAIVEIGDEIGVEDNGFIT